jgi:hypothetical protein
MACCNLSTTSTSTAVGRNSIADLLRRINEMQKAATVANANSVCDNCLISPMYNTKPIAVYLGCGNRFEAAVGQTGTTANLFRVEDVRGDDTVVLRLLQNVNQEVTCTTYTVVVRISCICCIQCFDPINCETQCFPLQ